jgi:hypothetical protein
VKEKLETLFVSMFFLFLSWVTLSNTNINKFSWGDRVIESTYYKRKLVEEVERNYSFIEVLWDYIIIIIGFILFIMSLLGFISLFNRDFIDNLIKKNK